ncbi:hypothetical protein D9M71_790230 [compost metagenome]
MRLRWPKSSFWWSWKTKLAQLAGLGSPKAVAQPVCSRNRPRAVMWSAWVWLSMAMINCNCSSPSKRR